MFWKQLPLLCCVKLGLCLKPQSVPEIDLRICLDSLLHSRSNHVLMGSMLDADALSSKC